METQTKRDPIPCPYCKHPLFKQIKGSTVKTVQILHRMNRVVGQLEIEIENSKLPLKMRCSNPECRKIFPMEFVVEKLKGIMLVFSGEAFEILNGKKEQITSRREKKLKKIYIKFPPK